MTPNTKRIQDLSLALAESQVRIKALIKTIEKTKEQVNEQCRTIGQHEAESIRHHFEQEDL